MSERSATQQAISARRAAIVSAYPACWSEMIRQWRAPRRNDAVWLTYSANYLFNTRGLRWAVDPVLLSNRVPEAPVLDAGRDLSDLDFALLYSAPPDYGPVPTTLNNGGVEIRKGICGDVNDDGVINMADVMTLWYDYANYPTPGAHEVSCC